MLMSRGMIARRYQDLICWQLARELEQFYADDHARFLIIGRSSLMETHNSAGAGLGFGYFSVDETDRMQRLAARSGKAATGLINYLKSLPPGSPWRRRRR